MAQKLLYMYQGGRVGR